MKTFMSILSSGTSKLKDYIGAALTEPTFDDETDDAKSLGTDPESSFVVLNTKRILPSSEEEEDPMVITYACKWLSEAINFILTQTDTDSADSFSNLLGLVNLLESKDIITTDGVEDKDVPKLERGMGCLEVLLVNILHSEMRSISMQFKLASSLFQALRLLRIMEVVSASSSSEHAASSTPELGITILSCKRLCALLQHLCGDSQVLEEMRPHLTKLLCFPISNKPGLHIQYESMSVVSSICKHGLSWQLIWFLHDNRVVQLMIHALVEIITNKQGIIDNHSEEADLWMLGTQCIVDLVASSAAVSGVLVQDFEQASGNDTLTRVICHSNRVRTTRLINLAMKLYLSSANAPDVTMAAFPVVLSNLIAYLFDNAEGYTSSGEDMSVVDLVSRVQSLVSSFEFSEEKDLLVRNLAISMLSLYSEDPHIFKERFTFNELVSITVLVPVLLDKESISSVLTVVTYVSQFYHSVEANRVMISLCAVASFITFQIFQSVPFSAEYASYLSKLSQVCATLCSIAKVDVNCSLVVLRSTLPYFIFSTLNQFKCQIESNEFEEQFVMDLSSEVLLVLHSCLSTKTLETFDEVRLSNLRVTLAFFVYSDSISLQVFKLFMSAYISLCLSREDTHIIESLQFIFDAIVSKFEVKRFDQVTALYETLAAILRSNSSAILVWDALDGFSNVLSVLNSVNSLLVKTSRASRSNALDPILETLLRSALNCISMSLSSVDVHSKSHKPINFNRNRRYFRELGQSLIRSGILESDDKSCVSIVDMILGVSSDVPLCLIASPGVIEVILEILRYLPDEVALYAITVISDYISSDMEAKKRLCDIQIVGQIVDKFHDVLSDDSDPLHDKFIILINEFCKEYLTVSDFISLCTHIVNKDLSAIMAEQTHFRTLLPWVGMNPKLAASSWTGLSLVLDLAASDSVHTSAPYLSFNNETSIEFPAYTISDITFSLWMRIPILELCEKVCFLSILNDEKTDTLMSFVLDVSNSCIIISSSKIPASPFTFKIPTDIRHSAWHLIVVSFKKTGLRSKVHVSVIFDTAICDNASTSDCMFKESAKAKTRHFRIGLPHEKSIKKSSTRAYESWRCGIIRVFNDSFSLKHALHMYLKGPNYLGTFREEDPLVELPSVYSSIALLNLRRKHVINASLIEYIGLCGIGLDLIGDPTIAATKHASAFTLEKLVFPEIEWQFAASFVERYNAAGERLVEELNMINCAVPTTDKSRRSSQAAVKSCLYVSPYCESVSSCTAALGGPSILLPLIHAASSESQLTSSLKLLSICCKNDSSNLKFMQVKGYKVLSFILNIKSYTLVTMEVLDTLLSLSVFKYVEEGMEYAVVFDAVAFYHLFLNHQLYGLRYAPIFRILNVIHDLTLCPKYAFINCARFSSIGLYRWILRLVKNITKKSAGLKDDWKFIEIADSDAANNDIFEFMPTTDNYLLPYFAVNILVKIAALEVRVLNFEPIQQMVDAIYSTFTSPSIEQSSDSTTILTSAALWRVILIRALMELFTQIKNVPVDAVKASVASSMLKMLLEIVNVKFIILVLLSTEDIASNTMCLRLFALLVETTPLVIREFIAFEGFTIIQSRLCTSLAFALPALGLFFRVPSVSVPYAQSASEMKDIQIRFLSEKFLGPVFTDLTQTSDYLLPTSIASNFVNPLLYLILDCIKPSSIAGLELYQSCFVLSTLCKAYDVYSSFKKTIVNKGFLDKLCSIVVEHDDLKAVESLSVSERFTIQINHLKELLCKICIDSVRSRNPIVVSYVCDKLRVVGFDAIKQILDIYKGRNDFDTLQVITAMFIFLVPLVKNNCFDINMSVELLELSAKLVRSLVSLPVKPTDSPQQKIETLIKDMSCVVRFISTTCLNLLLMTERALDVQAVKRVLNVLTTSVEVLLTKSGCEDSDALILDLNTESDSPVGGMFDIFGKSSAAASVDTAFRSSAIDLARSVSKLFCSSMIYMAFSCMNKDTDVSNFKDIVKDMCRIVAVICIRKYGHCRKMYGPYINGESADDGVDEDFFRDGLLSLLPDRSVWSDYILKVRSGEPLISGEDARIATFCAWARDSSTTYRQITLIRAILERVFPLGVKTSRNLKKVVASGGTDNNRIAGINGKGVAEAVAELKSRQRDFDYLSRRWLYSGFATISSGAIEWKRVWNVLVCGAIWGNNFRREFQQIECRVQETLAAPVNFSRRVRWKLDVLECPERSRTRLLQDVFDSSAVESKSIASSEEEPPSNSKDKEDVGLLMARLLREGAIRRGSFGTEKESDGADVTDLDDAAAGDVPFSTPAKSEKESSEPLSPPVDGGLELSSYTNYDTDASSLKKSSILTDIVKGIIGPIEWARGKTANVQRLCAMESYSALLIVTADNIHILRGFSVSRPVAGSSERVVNWEPLPSSLFNTGTSSSSPGKPNPSDAMDSSNTWLEQLWKDMLLSEYSYHCMPLSSIYTIYKKRYELKLQALEISDTSGYSIIFSCNGVERADKVIKMLLQNDLPNSIFSYMGAGNVFSMLRAGFSGNFYNSFLGYLVTQLTKMWQNNELTNFKYLMHLNAASGRSYHDLTQYPVFPWVIADYTSSHLDIEDPKSFRDLSKPVGALGAQRSEQYLERYESMLADFENGDSENPPFHYGTHYSCAGYVLHYLVRLQPFSSMAIELQGGVFDKPDRLFRSIESSWLSAAGENLQDVRELIPEFYCLPNFLCNSNRFDFGKTQAGDVIDDVILPPWANSDPTEFIRKQREALESRYVSEHLHEWIDLIFGYKQMGIEAENASNVFIHLTYAGEVDIDAITDPILRSAVISQINNFGQTPTQLFTKPHPKRVISDILKSSGNREKLAADPSSLSQLDKCTPPLCVIGAKEFTSLTRIMHTLYLLDTPIGDICFSPRDRIVVVPLGCILTPPKYAKILHYSSLPGKVSLHETNTIVGKSIDLGHELSSYMLHSRTISCACFSDNGSILATGSEDMTVRVWSIDRQGTRRNVDVLGVCVGHMATITCIDICTEFSLLASGSFDQYVGLWDLIECKLIRMVGPFSSPIESLSINKSTGAIAILLATELHIYSLNGALLAKCEDSLIFRDKGTVVLAPNVAYWQNGVVAVTGHEGGNVHLWRIPSSSNTDENSNTKVNALGVSYTLTKSHKKDITLLKFCTAPGFSSNSKPLVAASFESASALELYVGDLEGYVSRWAVNRLDELSPADTKIILSKYVD